MKKNAIRILNLLKKPLAITFLFSLVFVSSCKKDYLGKGSGTEEEQLTLNKSNEKVFSLNLPLNLEPFETLSPLDIDNLTEYQAIDLVQPIVDSGTILYNGLINQIVGTTEWLSLSSQEQFEILNLTPQQKAMLEVIYNAANTDASSGSPRWVDCAVAALGFNRAYTLFASAFRVGMSATTAIQVLKFVGLKYLGYIALAVAVYEFVQCVSSSAPVGTPDIPAGTPIIRNDLFNSSDTLSFPTGYSQYVYYTKYYTHIGDYLGNSGSHVPKPAIHIYLNPSDSKYYMDSAYTKILPDAFYILETDMNNNLSHKYREIINGQVVVVAYINNIDPYRALEAFDPATHLPFF